MTDKQIVETLKNIKEHCAKNGHFTGDMEIDCAKCKFVKHDQCQIRLLAYQLTRTLPCSWNMDVIERIIND